MEVTLSTKIETELCTRFGKSHNGVNFVKYNDVLKHLTYDFNRDTWGLKPDKNS